MQIKKLLACIVALVMIVSIIPGSLAIAAESEGFVARVNGVDYTSLADAVYDAVNDYFGERAEVTLLCDIAEDFTLDYGVVTLITEGHKYSGTATVNGGVLISDCKINAVCETEGTNEDETKYGYTSMPLGVEMVDGAQVRIGEGADEDGRISGEKSGLRFIAKVNQSDTLATLAYGYYDADNADYAHGYQLGVKITAESGTGEVLIPATLWQEEGAVFTVALTNLHENNYNRKFTANAYVAVEDVVFENNEGVARSIYQVAAGLLNNEAGGAQYSEMSEALVDVLNAYVNQTGVRLTLSDSTADATLGVATGNAKGAYSGEAVFRVGDTTYSNGMYTVVLEAIGRSVINTKLFSDYVRINNNNSSVSPATTITDNGDRTYTITFDYADIHNGTGVINNPVTIENGDIVAYIPQGVSFYGSSKKLELLLSSINDEDSAVEEGEGEDLSSFDIHVTGIAENNTTPIIITLPEIAKKGLNIGNLKLYHVEDGKQIAMEQVASVAELTKHNQFTYEPLDGTITVALASFSEVALVADSENEWNGAFDYSWYNKDAKELKIANADQLAAFGAIVGGMAEDIEQDAFEGKTVKLVSNINLGDKNNANGSLIFHPIGYYYNENYTFEDETTGVYSTVYSFEGEFDGNGHTISNFYQNTWEIKGDYSGNYYSDAMGLFGYVKGGTVKNLTVDNFSSDGEYTPTGVIAAYAVNSTFENIAITHCNPRVYNTGNGGIVGIGGNSDDPDTYKLTFNNITIDNTNKISALWGSWDVACGGLVGMFRGDGRVYMTNCHVAAQMDVNNDVCGNYQYYWYRYSGMLVGTNHNMTTDKDGYTVPETDKFHAENCTVHFGEWNDYYYCELVANSIASYAHDHQFSRLEEISSLDEIKSGETWTKAGNFLLIEDDKKTCYHIVNKDGVFIQHSHSDAGEETVNGETVPVEDKTIVYLPFNQLFTGYGWGVKHIPIYDDGTPNPFEGVTILDREVADSVEKFNANNVTELVNNKAITIGELFTAVAGLDEKVAIQGANVQVTVSPVPNTGSTIEGTYVADTTDWTNGTLTFTGTGAATITITDYYFCTPTTISVTVIERQPEVKFDKKFDKDFLYRVGNKNAVTLDYLFEEKVTSTGTISVSVETVEGNASGTHTSNATWTNGTIQFSGTGVVNVIITDNDYCIPTELLLEVVDATNLTSAKGTTIGENFVLLCDVNASNYVYYWNSTLYGNGFTYSLKDAPTAYSSSHGHGVLITKNATLDNVVIVGDVYSSYGAYTNQDYYNAAIDVLGDTVIQNCYISGCSAPISARANVTVKDTTLYGGTVGNVIIKSGTVTLEDVTTANYDDGRSLVGMGIVIHSDATESAKLILNGKLTQFNFISKSKVPTDMYAKELHSAMFGDSCSQYHFSQDGNIYVNTGIISLTTTFDVEDITDNANTGYDGQYVTVNGVNGYVYTQLNTSGSVNNDYNKETDTHIATTYGAVPPSYSFDYTTKNYVAKTEGSNDYCYEEKGVVYISMDDGDTFNWDTSILTLGKNIKDYTVSMNDTDYTGKSITFNAAGDYEVVYAYTDSNNFKLDENGDISSYKVKYTKTVNISVAVIKATTKHAEFTMGSSNAATEKITIDNATYVSATGVTADNSTWTYITIDGQKIYYPIIAAKLTSTKGSSSYAYFPVFENVVTITDYADNGTGDAFTYNSSTTILPSTLTAVKGIYKAASDVPYWYNLTNSNLTQSGASQIFKWASSSTAPSDPTTYNKVLCYKSPQISADRAAYITLVQYSYTDAANTTYYYYVGYTLEAFTKQTTCVTPETLITLADGSQVEIQNLKGDEELLVWNHETGDFDTAPVAYIVDHEGIVDNFEITTLTFDDGKEIEIIGEHVFFDKDAMKYVTLNKNASDYIGHKFAVMTDGKLTESTLVSVETEVRTTGIYEVVSYKNITCFTNNILSASAYMDGILNIFDIEKDSMKYNAENMAKDIETYGLYTYADFEGMVPEAAFELYNAQYLKVAVGKGYITWGDILNLIDVFYNAGVKPIE